MVLLAVIGHCESNGEFRFQNRPRTFCFNRLLSVYFIIIIIIKNSFSAIPYVSLLMLLNHLFSNRKSGL